jgi:hypothetical protein
MVWLNLLLPQQFPRGIQKAKSEQPDSGPRIVAGAFELKGRALTHTP